ncbi:MAG: hypothetical protein NTZ82_03635 [Bacteroidetes bacterium]|nr:hypothetical protein [Bacteroidota bacterium]
MRKILFTIFAIFSIAHIFAQKNNGTYKLNCYPPKGTSNIFTQADLKSKWFKDKDSGVGTSWTFFAYETVFNKDGVFLKGDLISPRGGKMNVKENGFTGQFYVLFNEWQCEADKN